MEYNPEKPLRICEIVERITFLSEKQPELKILAAELERIEDSHPEIIDLT